MLTPIGKSGFSRTLDDPGVPTGTAVSVFRGILGRLEPKKAPLHRECGRAEIRLSRTFDDPGPQPDGGASICWDFAVGPSRKSAVIIENAGEPDFPIGVTSEPRRHGYGRVARAEP